MRYLTVAAFLSVFCEPAAAQLLADRDAAIAQPAQLAAASHAASRETDVDARIADMLGSPREFRIFLDHLKRAAAAADKQTLAKMMKYPLMVSGGAIKVMNEQDFLTNFNAIFSPPVVAAIQRQAYADLFVRDSGAMIGGGEVWFTGVCADSSCYRRIPKVTAVNSPGADRAATSQTNGLASSSVGRNGVQVVQGSALPMDPVAGFYGHCRNIPSYSGSGALVIEGSLHGDETHCYRWSGRDGQTLRIELASNALGFNIQGLAENRYELDFTAEKQPYDIMLGSTFPGPGTDHYELRISYR